MNPPTSLTTSPTTTSTPTELYVSPTRSMSPPPSTIVSRQASPLPPPPDTPIPYSIFSARKKWFITLLAACAGMFSPLAANIYFPAIPTLSEAFHKTVQDINLTVTVYMIFQGITPTLWSSVADTYGRRPVYLACLTVFLLGSIGLALTPTNAYWLLMVLRCVSASGSAVVIALGAGTVGDISTPGERGKYMGVVSLGPMLGPCIGPVFGGLLNAGFGWRAIFWFLAILTICVLIPHLLFFPETLRSVVGNGSIPAKGLNVTLWDAMKRRRRAKAGIEDKAQEETKGPKKELNPLIGLKSFLEKDVSIVLFFNALNYTAFYAVTTTFSTLLETTYGLSTSKTGVCYLPIGFGSLCSTTVTGRLLDRQFRVSKAKHQAKLSIAEKTNMNDDKKDPNDLSMFPLEKARLRILPLYCFVFWSSVIIYGWLMQYRINLAAPLIFHFIIGFTIQGIMQICQVLLVDFYPGRGASVTANNNLCRCLIGAVGTAVIDPITNAIRPGWTLVIFVALPMLASPLMVLEWQRGMKWRTARAERVRVRAEAEKVKAEEDSAKEKVAGN